MPTKVTCFSLTRCIRTSFVRYFHSTAVINAGGRWRERNNLPLCGNEYGPMRDSPDFSFKDGRFIPLSTHQLIRKRRLINEAKTVIQLLGEIDYAVDTEKQLKKEEEEKRRHSLREKLKPKGNTLAKQS